MEPMNVTLYGKKCSANVIKLKSLEIGRLCWIIEVGPKCNNNCYYEAGKGKVETDWRGDGAVTIQAEIKVMWPQAKDAGSHQKLGQTKNRFSIRESGGSMALLTPWF